MTILPDENIEGHVCAIFERMLDDDWQEVTTFLQITLRFFRDVGLVHGTKDNALWDTCQDEALILITANRNEDGPTSLGATIRAFNTPASLPVFTLADADRVLGDRAYLNRVVERLLDYLLDIDKFRGTGRLYLP